MKDYYTILGAARTATAADLKRAYRKAAQKHHPDRSKESDAAERFKAVKQAYEFLSDEPTRQAIDIILDHRSSHLPRPDEVDTRNIRDRVLTTHGWALPQS